MKKLVSILILTVFVFSLCACNRSVIKKETLLESATRISLIRTDLAHIEGDYVIVAANVDSVGSDSITVKRESTVATVRFAGSVPQGLKQGSPFAFVGVLESAKDGNISFENAYAYDGTFVFAKTSAKSSITNFTYFGHTYDEQGRLTHFKTSGDIKGEISNKYDQNGNLEKQTSVTDYGTDVTTYTYDESGRLKTALTESDSSVNDGMNITYEYAIDEQGRVASQSQKNSLSPLVTTTTYTYDENGIKKAAQIKNDLYTLDVTYTYDDYGNLVSERSTDEGGNTYETVYTYECAYVIAGEK